MRPAAIPAAAGLPILQLAAALTWKEVEGGGHIATIVIEDGRLNRRMPDQPYNTGEFLFQSPWHLALQGAGGRVVEVTFEEVAPGQLIHEWRVVG
jgi:hypothetical protein